MFGRKRYIYVWLTLGVLWLYVIITGMNPPVVRGAIMASMFLSAELLGRQRSGIVALTLAAAIMVGVRPYILGNASFQLSFLAMAGLVYIFPFLRDAVRNLVDRFTGGHQTLTSFLGMTTDVMSASLAAVIAVWPVVAYYFGIVSLVGPLATFLALPVLTVVVFLGALAAVFGLLPAVGQVFGWLVWPFLSYLMAVVSGLAGASASSLESVSFHPAWVWGYYLGLAAVIWSYYRFRKCGPLITGAAGPMKAGINLTLPLAGVRHWVVVPLLVAVVLVGYTTATMPDDRLHVSFLDVGEGDAILISRGSQQVVIDGGPSPQDLMLALGKRMPFWDRTIEVLVLTHPHQDHLAGLVEVLRRYRVKQVVQSALDYTSPLYEEWRRIIAARNIIDTAVSAGQRIDLGSGVVIQVINPPLSSRIGTTSDIDNNGLVLRLTTGEISFVLTSDIGSETERELMREGFWLDGDVLKVAHHGSANASTAGFLAAVSPLVAVISCGADNRYGHPDGEVITRLEEMLGSGNIYRTDISGTIDFVTDGQRLWVDISK